MTPKNRIIIKESFAQKRQWTPRRCVNYGGRMATRPRPRPAPRHLIANRRDLKRPTNTLTSDASLPPPRSLSSTSTIIVWRTCIYSNIFEYFLIQIFVRTLFVSNLRCINISCFKAVVSKWYLFFGLSQRSQQFQKKISKVSTVSTFLQASLMHYQVDFRTFYINISVYQYALFLHFYTNYSDIRSYWFFLI